MSVWLPCSVIGAFRSISRLPPSSSLNQSVVPLSGPSVVSIAPSARTLNPSRASSVRSDPPCRTPSIVSAAVRSTVKSVGSSKTCPRRPDGLPALIDPATANSSPKTLMFPPPASPEASSTEESVSSTDPPFTTIFPPVVLPSESIVLAASVPALRIMPPSVFSTTRPSWKPKPVARTTPDVFIARSYMLPWAFSSADTASTTPLLSMPVPPMPARPVGRTKSSLSCVSSTSLPAARPTVPFAADSVPWLPTCAATR